MRMAVSRRIILGIGAVLLGLFVANAHAVVDGITGTTFNFTAKAGYITIADGGSYLMWGYANGTGEAQYPGPTLIVNEGDTVTVNLTNALPEPVSIVFPGHQVTAAGGSPGLLTQESAGPADTVTYTFTASHPGTYTYYSGTRPEVQIEMGLVGAIVVRPSMGSSYAYNHADTRFDHEYLFLLSEADPRVHELLEMVSAASVDNTTHFAVYWFVNGRAAPDTLLPPGVPWLPHQPYNILPRTHPGERVLLRIIGGGRDLHPYHTHGNHVRFIAVDGRLLASGPGAGPDLGTPQFTVQSVPGQTVDAIFEWTGKGLNWDIYGDPAENGHDCVDGNGDGYDDTTSEWCADHGKPIPVTLPELQNVAFGGFYSGSPFLGAEGTVPPGEGGLNPNAAFTFMWHSHTEKELTNYDIFPGGMMTMMFVEPPGTPIP